MVGAIMNPIVLTLIAAVIVQPVDAEAHAGLERLFEAIRQVETGGIAWDGRDALGDQGRSLGPYQIGRAYWRDSRVAGEYRDVRNAAYARRVMLAYWRRYCPEALARRDLRTLARIHNGGPYGCHKPATLEYWRRVSRHLQAARPAPAEVPLK